MVRVFRHEMILAIIAAVVMNYAVFIFTGRAALFEQALRWTKRSQNVVDEAARQIAVAPPPPITRNMLATNPFLSSMTTEGIRYHPLLDVAEGSLLDLESSGRARDGFPLFFRQDYFGFRNDEDLYFERDPSIRLVVMTGNSELHGVTHRVTIAQLLQRKLRERTGENWKVLNLAMRGGSLSYEINYFVHLGQPLKPEVVISHSGWVDMTRVPELPIRFQQSGVWFGFNLLHSQIWAGKIDFTNWDAPIWNVATPDADRRYAELTLPQKVISKIGGFADIARASGARFIYGLQPSAIQNTRVTPENASKIAEGGGLSENEASYLRIFPGVHSLMKEQRHISWIDFTEVSGIAMATNRDTIHTTDASADKIAEVYLAQILQVVR